MPNGMIERLSANRSGIFLRIRDKVYALKGPRSLVLYSERTRSGVRVIRLVFGWRITVRDVAKLQTNTRQPILAKPNGRFNLEESVRHTMERYPVSMAHLAESERKDRERGE